MESLPVVTPKSGDVMERGVRLSRSQIWAMMRAYYERAGVEAWRLGEVPHYVTSNAFIAEAYARILVGWLRDRERAGRADEPLTLLEVGAGSGRFAYHLLSKLFAEPRSPVAARAKIRYVMTDVCPKNIAFWRAHPRLSRFFDEGVLDVARFDATADTAMTLEVSGETLAPGAHPGGRALAVIANYVFDTLPQDVYRLKGGQLHECLVTVTAPLGVDPASEGALQHLRLDYEPVLVEGPLDVSADVAALVEEYQTLLDDGAFAIPSGAISCVRALADLAGGGGLLLLSADKGTCLEEELLYRDEPTLAGHGSFSLPVDYHAIGRFVTRLGGRALCPDRPAKSLCACAFWLDAPAGGVETEAAFVAACETLGPDDWFTLKRGFESAREQLDLDQLVAAVRLGGSDGKLLMDVFDRLLALAPGAEPGSRRSAMLLARRVWELHYEMGEERDLAFHLGVWMRELGYWEEAIRYFERSRQSRGETAVTAFNLAFCHHALERYGEAARFADEAIEATPSLPGARALRIEIRAAMRHERGVKVAA